jgi:LAO/AO transport system kinase
MKDELRREISRTISQLENRDEGAFERLSELFHRHSLKKTVCFTGPAGVGKSSLLSHLAKISAEKKLVCWLACDPSSPKTGGSLLGDRIRISGQEVSKNIFIRSLSTRSQSAFSKAIRDIQIYLEAYFDQIWVETAGTGQTQSDVSQISGLTVLILQPETGDEIQWMKSGIRECADIFVINKADLAGAQSMAQSLIELGAAEDRVFLVSTKTRQGLRELLQGLARVQENFQWPERLKSMHKALSRSLFLEMAAKRLESEFQRGESLWLKNPYQAALKSKL